MFGFAMPVETRTSPTKTAASSAARRQTSASRSTTATISPAKLDCEYESSEARQITRIAAAAREREPPRAAAHDDDERDEDRDHQEAAVDRRDPRRPS